MIELIDAAIAGSAVFGVIQAVGITKLAVKDFIVFWGEGDSFIVSGPFVVVNDSIGGISEGCDGRRNNDKEKGEAEEGDEGGWGFDGDYAGEVDGDGVEHDEVGGDLGAWDCMWEAVSGVLAEVVVWGGEIEFFNFLLHGVYD